MTYRIERWSETQPPNPVRLIQIMRAEGYSVFQWSDGPGATYSDHEHNSDQSHWIISGTLELNIDGFGPVELRPGDRDFLPAGTVHSARGTGRQPVVYLIGSKLGWIAGG